MFAEPTALAVTTPLATLATVPFEVVQVTVLFAALEGVNAGTKVAVLVTLSSIAEALSLMDCTGAGPK